MPGIAGSARSACAPHIRGPPKGWIVSKTACSRAYIIKAGTGSLRDARSAFCTLVKQPITRADPCAKCIAEVPYCSR
jgi:hypothetical protein